MVSCHYTCECRDSVINAVTQSSMPSLSHHCRHLLKIPCNKCTIDLCSSISYTHDRPQKVYVVSTYKEDISLCVSVFLLPVWLSAAHSKTSSSYRPEISQKLISVIHSGYYHIVRNKECMAINPLNEYVELTRLYLFQ